METFLAINQNIYLAIAFYSVLVLAGLTTLAGISVGLGIFLKQISEEPEEH